MEKLIPTDYNIKREMNKLYEAADEQEIETIFSSDDLEEYWENIKRNAATEVNIAVEKEEAMKADKPKDKADNVRDFISQLKAAESLKGYAGMQPSHSNLYRQFSNLSLY